MTEQQSTMRRRGFMKRAARLAIAAGAIIGGLMLHTRNGGTLSEHPCRDPRGRTGCGSCGLLAACGLPRGLSFKQAPKEAGDGR